MYGVWRWVLAALLTLSAAACSSDGDAAEVTGATVPTEDTTSTTLSVEQEVEQAYLESWDVYAKAMRNLDPSLLSAAFGEDALTLKTEEVLALKAANTPVRIAVEHNVEVVTATSETAELIDRAINHSVLIDPATGEPTEPDPDSRRDSRYRLKRMEGRWIVVFAGSL